VYEDLSWHCFYCQKTSPSLDWLAENGKDNKRSFAGKNIKEKKMEVIEKPLKVKAPITEGVKEQIKVATSTNLQGWRGITHETAKHYAVRGEFNEESGQLESVFYPATRDGKLVGYKKRSLPKTFQGIGDTTATVDMFGMFRYANKSGKYALVCEGEQDALAGFQMLKEYDTRRGTDFGDPVVVAVSTGAQSAAKQIAANYKFFEGFSKVIIAMDSDEAGQAAVDAVAKSLPRGKAFVFKGALKDIAEYLEKGKEKDFLNNYFSAQPWSLAGVVGSSELYEKLLEQAGRERIPLPPFMSKLEKMLGSFELQTCGVIAAGTGAAKTTIANEIIYHLLFNTTYKTGIVSLELDAGQYAQSLLSRHINNRISSIDNPDDRVAYLKTDDIKKKAAELFMNEDGTNRFMVLDERDFSLEVMEEKILEMIKVGGCQIIILDPVSDLFESLPHEAAAGFMKFLKATMKSYDVSFLLLAHIRKSSSNKDAASSGSFVPEEAIYGSGALTKSASWVAMLSRDKYNTDPIIRNTTKIVLSKNRRGSVTGDAGELYYCSKTHQMHDLDEWKEANGEGGF
jgi:thiol-disulfide isomerase/thioredoxin